LKEPSAPVPYGTGEMRVDLIHNIQKLNNTVCYTTTGACPLLAASFNAFVSKPETLFGRDRVFFCLLNKFSIYHERFG
jgi:hypothetical protein